MTRFHAQVGTDKRLRTCPSGNCRSIITDDQRTRRRELFDTDDLFIRFSDLENHLLAPFTRLYGLKLPGGIFKNSTLKIYRHEDTATPGNL